MHFKIGTRASPLALAQTNIFINELKKHQEFTYEIIKVKTTGDLILNKPLYEVGGKALFLKELEEALINKEIDIAVHSLKDVPGIIDERFTLPCYLERKYPQDCLLSRNFREIRELPVNAKIGTSSPRRAAFLKKIRPDLDLNHIRGNVNSRIARLMANEFDAIILAEAGVRRLNLYEESFCNSIAVEDMIPAVGQGVITCEILKENKELNDVLSKINHKKTESLVLIEREFLKTLQADCKTPVAGFVREIDYSCKGSFMVARDDFSDIMIYEVEIDLEVKNIGEKIAYKILKKLIL